MLSLNSRGLRLTLGALLLLGAIALAPTNASAQWSGETCMDIDSIPEMFEDEFGGIDHCESLCKKSADYCEKFVKDAASCQQTNYKGYYYFIEKTECDTAETSQERKECKQLVKEYKSSVKNELDSIRDQTLTECKDYENACIMDCNAPVL